jgi:hypothetical protein
MWKRDNEREEIFLQETREEKCFILLLKEKINLAAIGSYKNP